MSKGFKSNTTGVSTAVRLAHPGSKQGANREQKIAGGLRAAVLVFVQNYYTRTIKSEHAAKHFAGTPVCSKTKKHKKTSHLEWHSAI